MSRGKIFLVAVFALVFLIGVGLIIGGGTILWANIFMEDAEGFYTTKKVDVNRDSYAITSEPAEIEIGHIWILDWLKSIKVKITAENNKDKGVFIGIAEEQDLKSYLSGVEHDRVEELDLHHPVGKPEVEYENFPGSSSPGAPTKKGFWTASASGTGEQVLHWSLEEGTYATALMNADGSRGLNLSASIGAKVPVASGIGLGLAIAGLALILITLLLTYFTVTRSRFGESN